MSWDLAITILIGIIASVIVVIAITGKDEEELAEDLQKELFEIKRNPNIIEIPEGATNGDMMKTLFKNAIIEERDYGVIIFSISNLPLWYANKDWWNAPYVKETQE